MRRTILSYCQLTKFRQCWHLKLAAFTILIGTFTTCIAGESENKVAHSCNMAAIESLRMPVAVPGVDGRLPPIAEVPMNSSAILDASVAKKVYVRNSTVRRTATGTVDVRSMIANCTDFPLQVEARIQFYDSTQAPSELPSEWRRIFLSPRSDGLFKESSMGRESVSFYLVEIREGR
jgi:hypothetical protein